MSETLQDEKKHTSLITLLKIGIDVGGTLSINNPANSDVEINIPGAVETLTKLHSLGHQLYIVSLCGKERMEQVRKSLEKTFPDNMFQLIYFVKNKLKKGLVCASVGLDVMVDDDSDVCKSVGIDSPHTHVFHFGSTKEHTWPMVLEWTRTLKSRCEPTNQDVSRMCY